MAVRVSDFTLKQKNLPVFCDKKVIKDSLRAETETAADPQHIVTGNPPSYKYEILQQTKLTGERRSNKTQVCVSNMCSDSTCWRRMKLNQLRAQE